VGLFGILSASVLAPSLHGSTNVRHGMGEAEIATLIRDNPRAQNIIRERETAVPERVAPTWTVTYSLPAEPVDDFTKQMLTLVGTLMTAIASFYFGGRTAAPSDVSRAAPKISEILNGNRKPEKGNPVLLEILGTDLNSIRKVRLTQNGKEIEASSVTSNPNKLVSLFTFGTDMPQTGNWDVTVVDDIGRSDTKKDGLAFVSGNQTSNPAVAPPAAPTDLTPLSVAKSDTAAQRFIITGTNLLGVDTIVATSESGGQKSTPATIVTKTATEIECTLTLPTAGKWSVSVAAGAGDPVSIKEKVIDVS